MLGRIALHFGRILGYSTRNHSQLLENTRKKVTINARNYVFCELFRVIEPMANSHNPKVVGSNPSSATKKPPFLGGFSYFSEFFAKFDFSVFGFDLHLSVIALKAEKAGVFFTPVFP